MISVSKDEGERWNFDAQRSGRQILESLSSCERDSRPTESSSGLQGRFALLGSPGRVCYCRHDHRLRVILSSSVTWGIGMGAQDSLLKAVLTNGFPVEEPSTAFWVFDTGLNIAWFVGSAAMGWLYDRSVPALVCFSFALQVAARRFYFLPGV
jgi:hypothetical protein